MFRTFRIVSYSGFVDEAALDADQPATHLSRLGLNACAITLTYGLHEGLVSIDEKHLIRLIESNEHFLFVVRDLSSRRFDGAGQIVGCACMCRLRSLRRNDLRVTDLAALIKFVERDEVQTNLVNVIESTARELEVGRIILEPGVQDFLDEVLKTRGFRKSKNGYWSRRISKSEIEEALEKRSDARTEARIMEHLERLSGTFSR